MSVTLPPTIALKSSWFSLYLNYNSDTDSGTKRGLLRFNGANVFSPLAKFQVLAANTGVGLVHIRCDHNKKFVRIRSAGDVHLSPESDEPEEDQSYWTCTLFEPQAVSGNPEEVQFMHVQTKRYATAWDVDGIRFWRLLDAPHHQGIFDIIDLESMIILPKHLAFKGNNGLYLQIGDSNQLRFISSDKGLEQSGFEVFTDGDGRAKIKVFNSKNDNYLRFGGSDYGYHIFGDGDIDRGSEFLPVKIDASTAALICLTNNKFCKRYSTDIQDSFSAPDDSNSISDTVHLGLEERVLSRRVYDTVFDLERAIIYGETPIVVASELATNATAEVDTMELKFTHTESQSHTWTASHSWMVGMSVTASFKIPFIGGTEVTASAEYSGSYEWGETVTSERTLESTYTVTVPPHTTVSVSMIATTGKCDVPYSYYSRDVLYNGKTIVYKKDDGLCTGVNSYNFRYMVTSVKESASRDNFPRYYPIPMSMSSASINVQSEVTSATNLEQELSPVQVASSALTHVLV